MGRLALKFAGGGEVQLLSYTPRSLAEDDFYRRHCCSRSESGMEPYMELLPHAHKPLGEDKWLYWQV